MLGSDALSVSINSAVITTQRFNELISIGFPISDGNKYWYDAKAGLFGLENEGGWQYVRPGLDLGVVQRNASAGDSGVVINGRELTVEDVEFLTGHIGYALEPGRYWLNFAGVGGLEGGPARFKAPENPWDRELSSSGNGTDVTESPISTEPPERPRGSNNGTETIDPEPSESLEIEQLPRPIPKWTSRYRLPQQLLFEEFDTLGDVFDRLEQAMNQAEMYSWSAYAIHDDGFALVTQLESIDDSGVPKTGHDRWAFESIDKKDLSIANYITALLKSKPGRYRVIIFAVTHRSVKTSASETSPEHMQDLLREGSDVLPQELRNKKIQPQTRSLAFVYEFERDESTAKFLDSSHLQVIDHLAAGQYWERHVLR